MSYNVKVIKNVTDHKLAINELSRLMDLEPDSESRDFQTMELLAVLIEQYESSLVNLVTPDPIEAIKLRMHEKGLKQRDLATYLGSAAKVSEVLNRKRPLTLSMIKALSDLLDIPANVFMNGDIGKHEVEPNGKTPNVPIKELIRKNWLPVTSLKEQIQVVIDRLFPNKVFYEFAFHAMGAFKRQSIRKESRMDEDSLSTWIYKALELGVQAKVGNQYEKKQSLSGTIRKLRELSLRPNGPKLAQQALLEAGIALVILPHLQKTHIDGAAMLIPQTNTPLIALTLRYDRIDNFWFCLFHELGHIHLHLDNNCTIIPDDLDFIDDSNKVETEANDFARNSLIPEDEWNHFFKDGQGNFTSQSVFEFALSILIHPAIVSGRIRHELKDWRILSRMVGHNEVRKVFGNEYYSLL